MTYVPGHIQMSNLAIAKIASSALLDVSEIIAVVDTIKKRTDKLKFYKAITVRIGKSGDVSIRLPIVAKIKTPLHLLAHHLQELLINEIEFYTNLKVERVDVIICGIQ